MQLLQLLNLKSNLKQTQPHHQPVQYLIQTARRANNLRSKDVKLG